MMKTNWGRDTIARRFVLTITVAFAATFAMNALFVTFAGVWGRPSLEEAGLLESAATAVRMLEASPPANRPHLAMVGGNADEPYFIAWHPDGSDIPTAERIRHNAPEVRATMRRHLGRPESEIVLFDSDDVEALPPFQYDRQRYPDAHFMGVELSGGGWLVFTVPERRWGLSRQGRDLLQLGFMALSILVSAAWTARTLARPIVDLWAGVRRFGTDPNAPPIAPSGPIEVRATIKAFNAMQAQIARFVTDRTMMLAAISHDLRTPLTRMRLRAEFIGDPEQQAKLFRDVDEMQDMASSALAFLREDATQEDRTAFDLPELLLSIVDDYADQGVEIGYEGPPKAVFYGRPFALRRTIVNLVENAVKYATPPVVSLMLSAQTVEIRIRDKGPGIPEHMLDRVFAPFQRVETSRSRATGGVGLGLTSARSIIRAHGGDLVLRNHGDGCEALMTLPVVTPSGA
ncbi:ATP-binding protein [uncultured Enterovirga sp.]|uniref:ATP-binding protein n=1 Tax=uncultured Enterovirga sp. TaxID=2026352 RepID=UPI0035CB4D00